MHDEVEREKGSRSTDSAQASRDEKNRGFVSSSQIKKAVIAAAGFGTRFLPQTKAMPKEMLPLVDKPIIQHVVEELVDAGQLDQRPSSS